MSAHFRPRPITVFAVLAALASVAFLTLNPSGVVGPMRGAFVTHLFELTGGRGVGLDLDRAFNTALFLPLGAAVAAVMPWRWGLTGIVAGFAVSLTVEILQSDIPGRVSDPADVVWNTVGAGAGAIAVLVVRAIAAGIRAGVRRRRIRGDLAR